MVFVLVFTYKVFTYIISNDNEIKVSLRTMKLAYFTSKILLFFYKRCNFLVLLRFKMVGKMMHYLLSFLHLMNLALLIRIFLKQCFQILFKLRTIRTDNFILSILTGWQAIGFWASGSNAFFSF